MNKYEVVFYETNRYTRIVEAESEEEARSACDWVEIEELAEDMDFHEMEIVEIVLLENEGEDA